MFDIFNQVDDAPTSTESTQAQSSTIVATDFELTPQSVAHLIKNDFAKWHEIICANGSNAHYRSPQEVALVSFDAIASHCLPRVDLHTQSSKSELLHSYLSESLYVLEQPFLE